MASRVNSTFRVRLPAREAQPLRLLHRTAATHSQQIPHGHLQPSHRRSSAVAYRAEDPHWPAARRLPSRTSSEKNQLAIPALAPRLTYDSTSSPGGPVTVAWTDRLLYVKSNADPACHALEPTALRDSCTCAQCRDPWSGNKSFSTTEIPPEVGITDVRIAEDGLHLTLSPELARLRSDGGHETILPWSSIELTLHGRGSEDEVLPRKLSILRRTGVRFWDGEELAKAVRRINYHDYMDGGPAFWEAILDLCRLGIVYLHSVPRDEDAVARIVTRIANIRETLYGRTFDVRIKPAAENVAYTGHALGLHQDLLYLQDPPMIQVLHCMDQDDSSSSGGESTFSDGERIGRLLWPLTAESRLLAPLVEQAVPYAYTANGFHYFRNRPVLGGTLSDGGSGIVSSREQDFATVHWSPPFQGQRADLAQDLRRWIPAARLFESLLHADDAVHRHRLASGECVLFDNLRVLHGRTAFTPRKSSSPMQDRPRWLRGAYIAAEDFLSLAARIPAEQAERHRGTVPWTPADAQAQLQASRWQLRVLEEARKIDPSLRK